MLSKLIVKTITRFLAPTVLKGSATGVGVPQRLWAPYCDTLLRMLGFDISALVDVEQNQQPDLGLIIYVCPRRLEWDLTGI